MNEPFDKATPIVPDTTAFADHALLVETCDCWHEARGTGLIPERKALESVLLSHPDILPLLSLVDVIEGAAPRIRYMGSHRVTLRKEDHTNEDMLLGFDPDVRPFIGAWIGAMMRQPHIAYWRTRTDLPGNPGAESHSISFAVADASGHPAGFGEVALPHPAFEEGFRREEPYAIGSAGMEVVVIDVGLGVPDLPRSSKEFPRSV